MKAQEDPFGSRFAGDGDSLESSVALAEETDAELELLNATAPPPPPAASLHTTARTARALGLLSFLTAGLVERDTEARLLLLSLYSGEHLLLLGPPGVGKSQLCERVSSACEGAYFQRLLTRFTVPEELFGPLSLRSLEQDRYRRETQGYLPKASVAFLDEVFKANSATLNALLTVMNERVFDNGAERVAVPLLCLVAASNELPESAELDALYDRFLLRRSVKQVSAAGLRRLLTLPAQQAEPQQAEPRLTLAELEDVRAAAATSLVPPDVVALMSEARALLQLDGGFASDRRIARATRLLKVAACVDGRSVVALQDCLLLEHILSDAPPFRAWLLARVSSHGCATGEVERISAALDAAFKELCSRHVGASSLPPLLEETLDRAAAGLLGSSAAAHSSALSSLWLSPDDEAALSEALSASTSGAATTSLAVARDAMLLLRCLRADAPPHTLALLMPDRWSRIAKRAREDALSSESRLRVAIPPCGHRIARSYCGECLAAMFRFRVR